MEFENAAYHVTSRGNERQLQSRMHWLNKLVTYDVRS
jgi:hypothetical protein